MRPPPPLEGAGGSDRHKETLLPEARGEEMEVREML